MTDVAFFLTIIEPDSKSHDRPIVREVPYHILVIFFTGLTRARRDSELDSTRCLATPASTSQEEGGEESNLIILDEVIPTRCRVAPTQSSPLR
jgi:hypothetical protein